MVKSFVSITFILICSVAFSQIMQQIEPLYPIIQPAIKSLGTNSILVQQNFNPKYYQQPPSQIKMGATAEDVLRQANRNNFNYGYGNNSAMNQARIMAELQNDPAYNPSLRNATSVKSILSKNDDLLQLLHNEGRAENAAESVKKITTQYYKTREFAKQTQEYTNALKRLKNMLAGKNTISLADAYYLVESAYGDCYLTRTEYNAIIKKSAAFIREWMLENGLDTHNNDDIQLAIQKFMGEQLTITHLNNSDRKKSLNNISHQPFFYDFNDNKGEKDFKNFFLTKCLATGCGQCSSMPVVYLVLAEALGAKAYLTTVPIHYFIKYLDNNGNIINYEPTSNWKISDKWYQDNMFISPIAIKNHLYLDTLDSRKIVAECVFSLAFGYIKKFGATDGAFITDCITTAQAQFRYTNIQGCFIKSCMLARMLNTACTYAGINNYDDIGRSSEAKQLFDTLQKERNVNQATGV